MGDIIVWIIIGAVVLLSARSLYKTFTGQKNGCGSCGSGCSCNARNSCSSKIISEKPGDS